MKLGLYTVTYSRPVPGYASPDVLVTVAGPLGAVHVGTVSARGWAVFDAAARGECPPPVPGTALRGRWIGDHAARVLEELRRHHATPELPSDDLREWGCQRSAAERDAILVEFAAWAGSRAAFCRAHGVSEKTLRRWLAASGSRGRLVALGGGAL